MQDHGFVHGDLGAHNLFVGEGGVMKFADFGTTQGGNKLKVASG
ncbi:protein kinase [Rhizobium oryzicola]